MSQVGWRAAVHAAAMDAVGGADLCTLDDTFGPLALDVAPDRWVDVARALRDEVGCCYFDWLSAVDELDDGFRVLCHVARWGTPVSHVVLRTLVNRQRPRLASLVPVWSGAGWHERETHEMFGVEFVGGDPMSTLLLPEGFEGHPLRKDFVLASRVAKAWPGAKEPGESEHDAAPARRRVLPAGVPDAEAWGPRPARSPAADPLTVARSAGPPVRARGARRAPGRASAEPGEPTGG